MISSDVTSISCPICIEEITRDKKGQLENVTKLECTHMFHKKCFKNFKKSSNATDAKSKLSYVCPCCRADVVKVKSEKQSIIEKMWGLTHKKNDYKPLSL